VTIKFQYDDIEQRMRAVVTDGDRIFIYRHFPKSTERKWQMTGGRYTGSVDDDFLTGYVEDAYARHVAQLVVS
jgi:hypothetical protein